LEVISNPRHPLPTLPLKGRAIAYGLEPPKPFVLSLSKDLSFLFCKRGKGFDRLSPNGWVGQKLGICDSPALKGEDFRVNRPAESLASPGGAP
jgi:hypothetical protein